MTPNRDLAALRESLRVVYRDLAEDVARAGPVCQLSGRCCRFAEYDHTLFLSGPEAEILLADAPPPTRSLDDGLTCPWQDARNHCTAREARPLGCRVYYCEQSYQDRSHELSEIYLARLRSIAETFDHPWTYAPLHWHLTRAIEEGRYPGSTPAREEPAELDSPNF